MNVKEKRHRLPREFYLGEISVAFTLCLKPNVPTGFSLKPNVNTGFSLKQNVNTGFSLKQNVNTGFSLKPNVAAGFSLREPDIVSIFAGILASVVADNGCIVPVYCFMPDHQHLIITGKQRDADIWKAIISYKQKTGFWMSENKSVIRWQKDFYDHVIKRDEDVVTQVKYILDNPVRKGLVTSWQEYSYTGSIGCTLEDILQGIM
jgi:REP element-mobilizing transposase RayT